MEKSLILLFITTQKELETQHQFTMDKKRSYEQTVKSDTERNGRESLIKCIFQENGEKVHFL
jgi:hypothetical protein